jgi:glycosyltransferase involved in cell wall biosynthesis
MLYDIRILILSRGRCGRVTTNNLLPDYIEMLVPESERDAYATEYQNPILTIPDEEEGLGRVRNWVLDNFVEKTVIMIDDDIERVYYNAGERAERVDDKEKVLQIIINTAVMANDLGVRCFGFKQVDLRKFKGCEPFILLGWVGGVTGVIGRDYRFRDDKYKVDIDFCLQTLLKERVIWMDARYYFFQHRDNNTGGNSTWRTKKGFDESLESLKAKWKGCLKVTYNVSQVRIQITFKRKGVIKL